MEPERVGFVPFVWRDPPAEAANITMTWTVSQDSCDWTMPDRPSDASGAGTVADAEDGK